MKKEYQSPLATAKDMKHRFSLLAGSLDDITSGEGNTGDHGEAKTNGIFELDLATEEE